MKDKLTVLGYNDLEVLLSELNSLDPGFEYIRKGNACVSFSVQYMKSSFYQPRLIHTAFCMETKTKTTTPPQKKSEPRTHKL